MKQEELKAMTPVDLLGLWSARREGAFENPLPGEVASNCPTESDSFRLDDEMHVAGWVEMLPTIQLYRPALALIFAGGLMPQQAAERQTMIRQTSKRSLRWWQKAAREWGLKSGNPLRVGMFVIGQALDAIREGMQSDPPQLPKPPKVPNYTQELQGQTADVNEKAEKKYPDRFKRAA